MIKLRNFPLALLLVIFFPSCATTVRFQTVHPPLVDMRGVKTITVLPPGWFGAPSYIALADDFYKILTAGIKKSDYQYINPDMLLGVDEADYWQYVDVYVVGDIKNVDVTDRSETRQEKDGEDMVTRRYTTRTVTVYVEYTYVRTKDDAGVPKILRTIRKEGAQSETFEDSSRTSSWLADLLLDIVLPKGTPGYKIALSIIKNLPGEIGNELKPRTTKEKRRIEEGGKKDPAMKEAKKLAGQKKYFEALLLYKKIYDESGDIIAGFNAALLLEANGQFAEARDLLEELDTKISELGIKSPPFINDEKRKLDTILEDMEILMQYEEP